MSSTETETGVIDDMKQLRRSGLSYKAVGQHYNLTRQRVFQLIGKIEPETPRNAPVNPLAAIDCNVSQDDIARFPSILLSWRVANNLTQTAAAEILETNAVVISRWEQGRIKPHHPGLIIKFIKIWNYLLTE